MGQIVNQHWKAKGGCLHINLTNISKNETPKPDVRGFDV